MKLGTKNLIERKNRSIFEQDLRKYSEVYDLSLDNRESYSKAVEHMDGTFDYVYGMFTGKNLNGEAVRNTKIDFSEAVTTADFPILMRRVISEIMLEPKEPYLFLTNDIANTIPLKEDDPLSIEFPSMAPMTAGVVPEGGEYPNNQIAMSRNMISMRLQKIGLMTHISEEILKQSVYPLIAMYIRGSKNAIERYIEEMASKTLKTYAASIYDNNSANATYYTSGVDVNQNLNYSFTYYDLVELLSVLIGNRYKGTHLLAHPLAWSVFALDPYLRAWFYHGGQVGGDVWDKAPDFDQSATVPFGVKYVPYYNVDYTTGGTLASANVSGSTLPAALISDIYVIDKDNALFLATRDGGPVEEFEHFGTDTKAIKMRKYASSASKDQGRAMVKASNIRVTRAFNPVITILNV